MPPLLAFTFPLAVAAPPASAAPPADPGLAALTAGTHELTARLDGAKRPITVVLPYAAAPRPIVVALHWAGHGSTPHYATAFGSELVGAALAELDAVIVAPDCPGKTWTDDVSQRTVLAAIDLAATTWGGDPSRVVLVGYSMGGIGTWAIGAAHADRFRALVPMAGRPADGVADKLTLPVYAISGTGDTVIPTGPTERAIATLSGRGVAAVWAPVAGGTHYDTARYVDALREAVPWLRERLAAPSATP